MSRSAPLEEMSQSGRHQFRLEGVVKSVAMTALPGISLPGRPMGITMSVCPVLPEGCVMKMLSLKLPPGLSAKLERAARLRGESKSGLVRAALEQFLKTERPMSALELAGDLVGSGQGPGDLSTNPKHMKGFGE
jgi:hypothetical protein